MQMLGEASRLALDPALLQPVRRLAARQRGALALVPRALQRLRLPARLEHRLQRLMTAQQLLQPPLELRQRLRRPLQLLEPPLALAALGARGVQRGSGALQLRADAALLGAQPRQLRPALAERAHERQQPREPLLLAAGRLPLGLARLLRRSRRGRRLELARRLRGRLLRLAQAALQRGRLGRGAARLLVVRREPLRPLGRLEPRGEPAHLAAARLQRLRLTAGRVALAQPRVDPLRLGEPRPLRVPGRLRPLPLLQQLAARLLVMPLLLGQPVQQLRRSSMLLRQHGREPALLARGQIAPRLLADIEQPLAVALDRLAQLAGARGEAFLQPPVQLRAEQPPQDLFLILRVGGEQLAELALRQHDDLDELVPRQADELLQPRVHLLDVEPVDRRSLAVRRQLVQLGLAAGLALVARPAVGHLAEHAVAPTLGLEHELHRRRLVVAREMAAQQPRLRAVLAARRAVEGVAERVEDGRLARAGLAGDDEQPSAAQLLEVDRLLVAIGPEGRHAQSNRPHPAASSPPSTRPHTSWNRRFLLSLSSVPRTSR